jgi:hypothetical protein
LAPEAADLSKVTMHRIREIRALGAINSIRIVFLPVLGEEKDEGAKFRMGTR